MLALGGLAACKGKGDLEVVPAPLVPAMPAELTPVIPPQLIPSGLPVTGPIRAEENIAGSIQPNGVDVTPATPLGAGNIVQVLWNGTYYQGQVLSLVPDGTVRIHYVGWAASWDENIPRARLKIGPIVAIGAGAAPAHAALPPPPAAPAAAPGTVPGTAIDARTVLTPNQALMVEWNGRWYPSTVVRLNPDGTVRIHYVGWSDSFDEDAARARIHIP